LHSSRAIVATSPELTSATATSRPPRASAADERSVTAAVAAMVAAVRLLRQDGAGTLTDLHQPLEPGELRELAAEIAGLLHPRLSGHVAGLLLRREQSGPTAATTAGGTWAVAQAVGVESWSASVAYSSARSSL
jgi:hypothetical protein